MSEFFLAKCLLTLSGTPGTLKPQCCRKSHCRRLTYSNNFSQLCRSKECTFFIISQNILCYSLCPLLSPDILTLMRLNISVCCSKSFIIYKKLFKIWQFFYPVTEGMPLCKLMTLSRIIYSNKILIIESTCSHLVITFREKLYHAVP